MRTVRKPVIGAASAFLATCALVAAGVSPAVAETGATDPSTIDSFTAVADDALLDELASTPEQDGTLTPADGSVSLSVIEEDTVAVASVDGDAGVLVSRVTDAADTASTSYALTLPEGAVATLNDTNDVVSFFAEDGEPLGSSQTLWARDANGETVPTHLELDGTTLTQVVDLDGAQPAAFPIVAAAAASPNYYSSAWVTSQGAYYVVHAIPTAAGRRDSGAIYLATHTQQLKNKLGSNASKVNGTIENQFHCHVVFNSFMGSGNTAYDMESWRPNVSYLVAWSSGCNPEP